MTRLGFWELYLVRTGGFLVGSLVPVAGGLAVRLAYLRTRGLTYLDFTWATLLSNVLALGAAAVLAVSRDRGALDGGRTAAGRPSRSLRGRAGDERRGDRGLRTAPARSAPPEAATLAVAVRDAQFAGEPSSWRPGCSRYSLIRHWSQLRDLRTPDRSRCRAAPATFWPAARSTR